MTVAEKIKHLRSNKGLTQKQLGELCGIAESTIRRYELGLLNPKKETIEKNCRALCVSLNEIYPTDSFAYTLSGIVKEKELNGEEMPKNLLHHDNIIYLPREPMG